MTRLHYTPRLIAEFIEALHSAAQAQKQLQDRQAEFLGRVIGRSIRSCEVCGRLMIPRKLWEQLEPNDRPLGFMGASSKGKCTAHQNKGKPNRLDPANLDKLRALSGYDPNRDYETEDEQSA